MGGCRSGLTLMVSSGLFGVVHYWGTGGWRLLLGLMKVWRLRQGHGDLGPRVRGSIRVRAMATWDQEPGVALGSGPGGETDLHVFLRLGAMHATRTWGWWCRRLVLELGSG